jgi:diguanylate cyclase (GGDEF)-like protein
MQAPDLPREDLMAIIEAQTELAKLGMDLGAMLDFVASMVQRLTRAQGAIVELAEDGEMVYRAATGMAEAQLGMRLAQKGSLSGLCLASDEILTCSDSETDPRVDLDACRRVGVRSMLVAPLKYHKTPVGVLKIASSAPDAFGPRDAAILALTTDLIGAAIYKASDFGELYRQATHDPLTGAGNRALFYDRIRQGLHAAQRRSTGLGVVMLDMDGLKPINDQFGHQAGDAAIRELAKRLIEACRQVDTVARLGGDEFGVVLTDMLDRPSVEQHAERLSVKIEAPFSFDGRPLPLAASIGTSIYPHDGPDPAVLLAEADKRMYEQKKVRKGGN